MVNGKSNGGVVATARGIFTHEGGVLESQETGVSLRVPPGAIPHGVQQEIYFNVCRANEAHLPPLDADRGRFLPKPQSKKKFPSFPFPLSSSLLFFFCKAFGDWKTVCI